MTGESRRRATNRGSNVHRPAHARLGLTAAALMLAAACSGSSTVTGGEVFRVEIEACAGVSHQRATAMAVGPDLVATAAHTFESGRRAVLRTADGAETTAEIAYLDLDRDVALLSVDTTVTRIFDLAEAADGAEVTIPTYADPEGVEIKEATVLRSVNATLDGEGRRRAVELSVSIDRGDSGAPVVDENGRAVGMVFAASRRDDRGWALAASELEAAIAAVADDGYEPPPSPCRQ